MRNVTIGALILKLEGYETEDIYIVKTSEGYWDTYVEFNLFATSDKQYATDYCERFNRIVKEWREYYTKFEGEGFYEQWIKDEYYKEYGGRYYRLKDQGKCFIEEIEVRK